MKKLLSVLAVIGLVFVYACGGGGDDPKALMLKVADVFDQYVDGLDKVESADDVVKVTEKSTAEFEKLAPKMKALMEKHPELKIGPGKKLPQGYEDIEKRFEEMGAKMMAAMGKAMKFMQDPKVQEAQKKWMDVMAKMK